MGFYGLVMASVAIICAFAAMNSQHDASAYAALASSFASFERVQYISAFQNLLNQPDGYNSSAQSSWLASVTASARADGLNATVYGNTLVVSDGRYSHIYAMSWLNAG